jgi:hypothetical protein
MINGSSRPFFFSFFWGAGGGIVEIGAMCAYFQFMLTQIWAQHKFVVQFGSITLLTKSSID